MTAALLDQLVSRIRAEEILDEPVAEDGIVHGRARFEAAGVEVAVNIDPELDEDGETDAEPVDLVAALEGVLAMSETQWRAVTDAVIAELEAVDTAEPAADQVDLDNDLEARSLIVFADAVLVRFEAPRRFPASRILAQLDDAFDVEGVDVEDDDDIDTVAFDSLDDLIDHLTDGR
ncbi:MAG: cytochrome C5 [Microbacterium arborescens]